MVGVVVGGRLPSDTERDQAGAHVGRIVQAPVREGDLPRGDRGAGLLDDRGEQALLVAEVVVDGAFGHTRLGGNGIDSGAGVALGEEHAPGRPEDHVAFGRRVAARSAGHETPCWHTRGV
ncbi:hypothetical protein GCM10023223_02220 [Stackebrandtia albiflava]